MLIYIGYALTAVNYICYCLSRFARKKITMLILDLFSKIIMVGAFYCLDSLSGSFSMLVIMVGIILSAIKERHPERWDKKTSILVFLLPNVAYITILALTFDGLPSILAVGTSVVYWYSVWWLSPQPMRLVGGFNSIAYLAYQILIKNWAGLVEIFVLISNFSSYAKYRREGKALEETNVSTEEAEVEKSHKETQEADTDLGEN